MLRSTAGRLVWRLYGVPLTFLNAWVFFFLCVIKQYDLALIKRMLRKAYLNLPVGGALKWLRKRGCCMRCMSTNFIVVLCFGYSPPHVGGWKKAPTARISEIFTAFYCFGSSTAATFGTTSTRLLSLKPNLSLIFNTRMQTFGHTKL